MCTKLWSDLCIHESFKKKNAYIEACNIGERNMHRRFVVGFLFRVASFLVLVFIIQVTLQEEYFFLVSSAGRAKQFVCLNVSVSCIDYRVRHCAGWRSMIIYVIEHACFGLLAPQPREPFLFVGSTASQACLIVCYFWFFWQKMSCCRVDRPKTGEEERRSLPCMLLDCHSR